jgi:hypothetical protein
VIAQSYLQAGQKHTKTLPLFAKGLLSRSYKFHFIYSGLAS